MSNWIDNMVLSLMNPIAQKTLEKNNMSNEQKTALDEIFAKAKDLREDKVSISNPEMNSYSNAQLKAINDAKEISVKIALAKKEKKKEVKRLFMSHVYLAIDKFGIIGNKEQISLMLINTYQLIKGIPEQQFLNYKRLILKQLKHEADNDNPHNSDYKKSFASCLQSNVYGRWVLDYDIKKKKARNLYMLSAMVKPNKKQYNPEMLTTIASYMVEFKELVGIDLKNGIIAYWDDRSAFPEHLRIAKTFRSNQFKDAQSFGRQKVVYAYWVKEAKKLNIKIA